MKLSCNGKTSVATCQLQSGFHKEPQDTESSYFGMIWVQVLQVHVAIAK